MSGHISERGVKDGTHVACFCPDCRAAELYFGQPDPAPGPVDILQLSPDAIQFDSGYDKLGLMRLGPNGLFRWYATCCNVPMFNTLKSRKTPFVSVFVGRIEDSTALGPVVSRSFAPQPDGSRQNEKIGRAVYALFARMLTAYLSGRWRTNPFFDANTGEPVATAAIPTKAERKALYPL